MTDDIAFPNMSPNTQTVYAYAVANFALFHRQSPDKLGLEQGPRSTRAVVSDSETTRPSMGSAGDMTGAT
jgi:hypothetical protein